MDMKLVELLMRPVKGFADVEEEEGYVYASPNRPEWFGWKKAEMGESRIVKRTARQFAVACEKKLPLETLKGVELWPVGMRTRAATLEQLWVSQGCEEFGSHDDEEEVTISISRHKRSVFQVEVLVAGTPNCFQTVVVGTGSGTTAKVFEEMIRNADQPRGRWVDTGDISIIAAFFDMQRA